MVKAIKTVSTEIEIPTPFYYKYTNESHSFTMVGLITDGAIFEINEERYKGGSSFEISINNNVNKEDVFPYMYENPITKEEFENYYCSVMHVITSQFENLIKEEL